VTGIPSDPEPGSNEAFVIDSYNEILGRPASVSEYNFYLQALREGKVTRAKLILQLLQSKDYAAVRNKIFNFCYRLGVAPTTVDVNAYSNILANPDNPAFNNALLPISNYPPFSSPTPPFGSTVGQATVAQLIIDSPAFLNAWPQSPADEFPLPSALEGYDGGAIRSLPANDFLRLFLYPRMGGQVGDPFPVEAMMNTFSPPQDAQGSAVAFLSAMYANVGLLNGEVAAKQVAYQYQLWASSVQWLLADDADKPWVAPTNPIVSNEEALLVFIGQLIEPDAPPMPAVSFASWAASNDLQGTDMTPQANPAGDDISNLLKFAFNLDPAESYVGVTQTLVPKLDDSSPLPGGNAGLPYIAVGDDGRMVVQFVRRRNADNVVNYEVQFSSDLNTGWQKAADAGQVETLDATWERVTVRDTANSPNRRFGRVKVTDLTAP
jgi:hypothetical protein